MHPFLPPALFQNRGYLTAVGVAFFAMLTYVAAFVVVPLLVVADNGLSTRVAGLVLAPSGLAVAMLSPVVGRLSDRVGARAPILAGLVMMGLSTLFISSWAAGESPLLISLGLLGVGIGFACINAPASNAATSALPEEQVGVGVGLFQWAFHLGAGVGPVVIGAFLVVRQKAGADAMNPVYALDAAPFSDAFLAMTAAVGLALLAALAMPARHRDGTT